MQVSEPSGRSDPRSGFQLAFDGDTSRSLSSCTAMAGAEVTLTAILCRGLVTDSDCKDAPVPAEGPRKACEEGEDGGV